jgi:hypothetical protein
MSGAAAAPMLAAMCTAVATMSGSRRPTLSLHGPTSSWPTPKPMVVAVRVSCTRPAETARSSSSDGKAGR